MNIDPGKYGFENSCPLKMAYVQGRSLNLPEGIVIQNLEMNQLQYVPTIINN